MHTQFVCLSKLVKKRYNLPVEDNKKETAPVDTTNDNFGFKKPEASVVWNNQELSAKMDTSMPRRRVKFKTRLAKKESQRMVNQSVWLLVFTGIVVIALIFWGIPSLIRLAGFLGEIKNGDTVPEDTLAPLAPQLDLGFDATRSAELTIRGYAESGVVVKLSNNGLETGEATVGDEGSFEFVDFELDEGDNELALVAIDNAGNESEVSKRTIVFDNTDPKLSITKPENGASFGDSQNRTIDVEGESESDVEVYVNDRLAIVGSDGKFSQRISLNDGDNEITVRAVDRAGNESEKKINVRFEL